LAGFQVTLIGRFWVTPEGKIGALKDCLAHDDKEQLLARRIHVCAKN